MKVQWLYNYTVRSIRDRGVSSPVQVRCIVLCSWSRCRCINGTGEFNAGSKAATGKYSIQRTEGEGAEILVVASWYATENSDKLRPDGPLGPYARDASV